LYLYSFPTRRSSDLIGFLNTLHMDDKEDVDAYYTIARPNNAGKDSLAGHYEMMGIVSNIPFKTFNENGFPIELIDEIEKITGRRDRKSTRLNSSHVS